jgi:hypothetical protein
MSEEIFDGILFGILREKWEINAELPTHFSA